MEPVNEEFKMPQEKEERRRVVASLSIMTWWHKFHFSGRVIMCSVLFGLGLILIGGIIFAINVNDDSSKSKDGDRPSELPTKAPSNFVGPVIMGIGGFIVVVGIIMCLFETQVCRKKTGDSSPLITENASDPEGKHSEPSPALSTSDNHKSHRHRERKISPSPKKSKGHRVKSRSKERKQKTPPISIETSKSFLTSSEDKFLTPPSTIGNHPTLVKTNSRDAENQTSSSLMKSFNSSDPSSWTQSTEFQTPAASFRDSSVSLENSLEISGNHEQRSVETSEMPEISLINSEFMTPVSVEEENPQKMAAEDQNQEREIQNSLSKKETDACFSEMTEVKLSNSVTIPTSETIAEDKYSRPLQAPYTEADDQNKSSLTEKLSFGNQIIAAKDCDQNNDADLDNNYDLLLLENDRNASNKSSEVDEEKVKDEILNTEVNIGDRPEQLVSQDEQNIKSKFCNESSHDIEPMNEKDTRMVIHDANNETLQKEVNKNDVNIDLGSSGSSEETVVAEDTAIQKHINKDVTEKCLSEKGNMMDETTNLNAEKSAHVSVKNDSNDHHNTQLSISDVNEVGTKVIDVTQENISMDGNLGIPQAAECVTSSENNDANSHNTDADMPDGNENRISDHNDSKINNIKVGSNTQNFSNDKSS